MAMTPLERAQSYIAAKPNERKIFALLCKAGNFTDVLFTSEEGMEEFIHNPKAVAMAEDGLRWSGHMIDNVGHHSEFLRLRLRIKWDNFKCNKRGLMSDAQEQLVCEALNTMRGEWYVNKSNDPDGIESMKIRRLIWKWVGNIHRRGMCDLIATDAFGTTWRLEVKGIRGRLFWS